MMADKLDMSLDDIIKKTRVGVRGQTGGARRGGGFGAKRRDDGGSRPFRGNSRGGGGGGRGGGGSYRAPMRSPYSRGNADEAWTHDMFDGPTGGRNRASPSRGGVSRDSGSSKIVVSNLDFGVSDSDIHELFSEFGRVKSAAVHYDKSGRSLGSADVVFERRTDALKALKEYNGVPLDGRPMDIKMVTAEPFAPAPRFMESRLGTRVEKSYRDRPRTFVRGGRGSSQDGGRKPNGGGRGGRGARNDRPAPTKDDLDAELDSYLQSR